MSGFFGQPKTLATGGGGTTSLGSRLAYASPSGGAVAAAPAGFSSAVGRLIVTLPGGNATWISLTPGADGQLLDIKNADVANSLTLPAADFPSVADQVLPPGNHTLLYYDATDGAWNQAEL